MLLKSKRSWEIAEANVTPESVVRNRRRFLTGAGGATVAIALSGFLKACEDETVKETLVEGEGDPSASLYPVKRNPRYEVDRALTDEDIATGYNNYVEFGSSKSIQREAQKLPLRPWVIEIDGDVEQPITISIDDLLARMPLEERVYRHRCVETWAITVPWSGFPLASLVEMARPGAGAKYLRMTSFLKPDFAKGQRSSFYDWPYIEGLTIEEATNELAFISTGMYGKPLPEQNGAPLRLTVPWKYGFKCTKGIVRFTFTDERPVTFWEMLQGDEYGFWANVNPMVPHRRWSQATERLLGTDDRVPTLLYNGYAEQVASLYAGRKDEQLFM
ncbi:MAG: protein-methionine-sulfoxide reductase catalytic subunit MsrP [Hyphomicrobiales bacterium]|nr:protein-methionine-sulfoxide reductase catalytic subunit MsrP [Hyphomicrobiales bacterium]